MPQVIVENRGLYGQAGGGQVVHAELEKQVQRCKLNSRACNAYGAELKPSDHLVSSRYRAMVWRTTAWMSTAAMPTVPIAKPTSNRRKERPAISAFGCTMATREPMASS